MRELRPGIAVRPNIRLVRPLSEGGMGALWIADHLTLDTEVVVKFIHPHLHIDEGIDSEDLDRRFEVEAKVAARVKSPHIVQIFDYGRMGNGSAFIVMEKLEGESLETLLSRRGWLSLEQCAEIVRQMCVALTMTHAEGIIHRDIKPANIWLCPSDDGLFVKLVDFGIARDHARPSRGLTSPGRLVGSVDYVCRDQILGAKTPDEATDLWALAVCTYEMLCGDVPFTADSDARVLVAIMKRQYTPPSQLRKAISSRVDAWFERALHAEPERRFANAREFASSLRAALLGDEPAVESATEEAGDSDEEPSVGAREPDGDTDDGVVATSLPLERRSRWPLALITGVVLLGLYALATREAGPASAAVASLAAHASAAASVAEPPNQPPTEAEMEPTAEPKSKPKRARAVVKRASSSAAAALEPEKPPAEAAAPTVRASAPPPPVQPTEPDEIDPRADHGF